MSLFVAVILENLELGREDMKALTTDSLLPSPTASRLVSGRAGAKGGAVSPRRASFGQQSRVMQLVINLAVRFGVTPQRISASELAAEWGEDAPSRVVPSPGVVPSPRHNRARRASPAGSSPFSSGSDTDMVIFFSTKSLLLFPPSHPLRLFLCRITRSRSYEMVLLVCIILSSWCLTLETPEHIDEPLLVSSEVMSWIDVLFLWAFGLEFLTKIVAEGVLLTPNAYFRCGWNVVDFVVLSITFVHYLATKLSLGPGSNVARILRLGRVLRPLRMMKTNVGMRDVINALISSFSSISYVVLLCFAFFIIFSILGVGLFAGQFSWCNSPDVVYPHGREACVGLTFHENEADTQLLADSGSAAAAYVGAYLVPAVWDTPWANFDDVVEGLLSLFRICSLEWEGLLFNGLDSTRKDTQPETNHSPLAVTYFVSFVFTGAFFLVNLYSGVIIEHYRTHKGIALMSFDQTSWMYTRTLISRLKPSYILSPPSNPLRKRLWEFVHHRYFKRATTVVIIVNVGFMASTHSTQTEEWKQFLDDINLACSIIFIVELLVQLFADGPKRHLSDPWNSVNAIIVSGSFIGSFFNRFVSGSFFRDMARLFQVLKMVKFVDVSRGMKLLLDTFLDSLMSMLNILLLLFLTFSIFAVLGVTLFGSVKPQFIVGRTSHFSNYFAAMLTLFQIISGDSWDSIMDELRLAPPYCTPKFPSRSYGDCGQRFAPLYFFAFLVTVSYMLLNLFIAVLMETFSYSYNKVEGLIPESALADFQTVWAQFVPEHQKTLPLSMLRVFITTLGEPLGCSQNEKLARTQYLLVRHELVQKFGTAAAKRGLKRRKKQVQDVRVSFKSLLFTLAYWYIGLDGLSPQEREARELSVLASEQDTAALVITAYLRKYLCWKNKASGQCAGAATVGANTAIESNSPHSSKASNPAASTEESPTANQPSTEAVSTAVNELPADNMLHGSSGVIHANADVDFARQIISSELSDLDAKFGSRTRAELSDDNSAMHRSGFLSVHP